MGNSRRIVNSQITNFKTIQMYQRQCLTLAENVFNIKNLPSFISVPYMNKSLLRQGAVAFFYDDILESLVAFPFTVVNGCDMYGRPLKIAINGQNGYHRVLNKDEFVIMYDNNGMYPLYLDIIQYAERLAIAQRTIDINLIQQRTPRIWQCEEGKEKSILDLISNIDSFSETVVAYNSLLTDGVNVVSEPAPFVADKVEDSKDKIWNEFLRLIGVANVSFQKKERAIRDEILALQGGTIASRFSRYEPREKAILEINKKFAKNLEKPLELEYYDGIPSTSNNEEFEAEEIEEDESEVLENA